MGSPLRHTRMLVHVVLVFFTLCWSGQLSLGQHGMQHNATMHGTMQHNSTMDGTMDQNATSHGMTHQNAPTHGMMDQNSTSNGMTHQNPTMHGMTHQNSTMHGSTHNKNMNPNATMDHGSVDHGNMQPTDNPGPMDHGGGHGGDHGSPNTVNPDNGYSGTHDMGSGMTHDGTPAGGHGSGHGSGSTAGHYGYFHTTYKTVILFEEWVTSTWQGLLGSCIGIAVATILYEGLKVFRSYLLKKSRESRSPKASCLQRMCSCGHFVQTLLHIVQMVLSYLLMLVFMTFNLWLCVAIAIGFGLGYFLFRWDLGGESVDSNDHCM